MKKIIRMFLATFLLLGILMTGVANAREATTISPRLIGITNITSKLTISDAGCARCSGLVSVRDGYTVDLTVELKQDGTTIKTWTGSGSGTFDAGGIYYVASGHTYVVTATATVYNSSGKIVETPSQDSPSKKF